MKKLEVFAMPMVTGTSYLPSYVRSEKTREDWLASLPTKHLVKTWHDRNGDLSLYTTKYKENTTFIGLFANQLVYAVELETVPVVLPNVHRVTSQISVWKTRQQITSGFLDMPEWVFRNLLVSKSRAIMTDGEQTELAQRFWFRRLHESLVAGHKVYGITFNNLTNDATDVEEITELAQVAKYYTELGDYAGMEKRLVITK